MVMHTIGTAVQKQIDAVGGRYFGGDRWQRIKSITKTVAKVVGVVVAIVGFMSLAAELAGGAFLAESSILAEEEAGITSLARRRLPILINPEELNLPLNKVLRGTTRGYRWRANGWQAEYHLGEDPHWHFWQKPEGARWGNRIGQLVKPGGDHHFYPGDVVPPELPDWFF
jgi:hypothetical protein